MENYHLTKDQQFKQEDTALRNRMDRESEIRQGQKFIPVVGMKPKIMEGNGYKGIIEYVGCDYFILRCSRTGNPILIKPLQYHLFFDYSLPEDNTSNLNPIFQDILNSFFKPNNFKP